MTDQTIDDYSWDELPTLLQRAAAKLGFNQQLWDNDEETKTCERSWTHLTSEQRKAARLLGYTPKSWDKDDCSSESSTESEVNRARENDQDDHWIDSPKSIDDRINTLKNEIARRQKKLKRLLRAKQGTAYARMLESHEECVNSHLQQSLNGSPSSVHENQPPSLKQNPLQLIRTMCLNEYYHALPGCVAITLHCLIFSSLTDLVRKLTLLACQCATADDWDIIDNNYDDSSEEHLFFIMAILFSFALLRATGQLFEWNENRAYQRKIQFHFRNRWHMGCFDMRVMNWFSGGELSDKFVENTRAAPGPNIAKRGKWGPRLKTFIDACCWFLLYGCVDHLVDEFGPKMLLNMKQSVLEGLPSRELHKQWNRTLSNGQEETYCIKSEGGNDGEECRLSSEMDFVSDIWNWVENADRCGWVQDDEQGEDDVSECDDCPQKQENDSGISSIAEDRGARKFKPWKQHNEEWKQTLTRRDDEYLRDTISLESYYLLVGDPDAHFIDPAKEMLFLASLTGLSLGCLNWMKIPYQLGN